MSSHSNKILFDFLLTQTVKNRTMPYDFLQNIIDRAIERIKSRNLNAQISNMALNIDGKLVLGQIYIERKNGFCPSKSPMFGTSPTFFNVQIRFPFGLETELNGTPFLIPNGNFQGILQPYQSSNDEIYDDVSFETLPTDFFLGEGIYLRCNGGTVLTTPKTHQDFQRWNQLPSAGTFELSCNRDFLSESIAITYEAIYGAGYTKILNSSYYSSFKDYSERLKIHGLYPLFYSGSTDSRYGLLADHPRYEGFTEAQKKTSEMSIVEIRDGKEPERLAIYRQKLATINEQLLASDPGKTWEANLSRLSTTTAASYDDSLSRPMAGAGAASGSSHLPGVSAHQGYLLNLEVINGRTLLADSGMDVTRAYAHQVELFERCQNFERQVNQQNRQTNHRTTPPSQNQSGVIEMGVGAGKTFFTYTLLQYFKHQITTGALQSPAPYCFAPDPAVAEVTAKVINRQGAKSGVSSVAITRADQIPDEDAVRCYCAISERAAQVAVALDDFLKDKLQQKVLNSCFANGLHLLKMMNFLYGDRLRELSSLLKNSVDPKRLILMIEGQKVLTEKTGMLGFEALKIFSDELKTLLQGIEAYPLGVDARVQPKTAQELEAAKALADAIEYTGSHPYRKKGEDKICYLPELTQEAALREHLNQKCNKSQREVRDTLQRISCLTSNEGAVLTANSGGLRNTYTDAEISEQITRLLPFACKGLKTLLDKSQKPPESPDGLTLNEHFLLYLHINEMFSTIPDQISIRRISGPQGYDSLHVFLSSFPFIQEGLNAAVKVTRELKDFLDAQILGIPTLTADESAILSRYGISPSANIIEATNQMAGIMGLRLTGSTQNHPSNSASQAAQSLLLNHIPIFTPEGFVAYLEQLDQLEGKPGIQMQPVHGLYQGRLTETSVTGDAIKTRLREILNSIMVADEVHKEAFKLFFDETNALYQRANVITQKYFRQNFRDMLPHRMGMSGTPNEISQSAFSQNFLYTLPIQKMIRQNLTKTPTILSNHDSFYFLGDMETGEEFSDEDSEPGSVELAKKLVVQYFGAPALSDNKRLVDIFGVSQGLIFSKIKNPLLNQTIADCFESLLTTDRFHLFEKINQLRATNGQKPLTSGLLKEMRRIGFRDYCFAIYLEFILSKTSNAKEMSTLISLQNLLWERNSASEVQLTEMGAGAPSVMASRLMTEDISFCSESGLAAVDPSLLESLRTVSLSLINEPAVRAFVSQKIEDSPLKEALIAMILESKNNLRTACLKCETLSQTVELPSTLVCDASENSSHQRARSLFESRQVMAMIGSEGERTGYSHEPVGVVVDASLNPYLMEKATDFTTNYQANAFQLMTELIAASFSYDEKTQVGGRALRVNDGQVMYQEYLSSIHELLETSEKGLEDPRDTFSLRALRVETSFSDIFTSNQAFSDERRASIRFNGNLFSLLNSGVNTGVNTGVDTESPEETFESIFERLKSSLRSELEDEKTNDQYVSYILERLPLVWSMKNNPDLARTYFSTRNEALFHDMRVLLLSDMPTPVVRATPAAPTDVHPTDSRISDRSEHGGEEEYKSEPTPSSVSTHPAEPPVAEPVMANTARIFPLPTTTEEVLLKTTTHAHVLFRQKPEDRITLFSEAVKALMDYCNRPFWRSHGHRKEVASILTLVKFNGITTIKGLRDRLNAIQNINPEGTLGRLIQRLNHESSGDAGPA